MALLRLRVVGGFFYFHFFCKALSPKAIEHLFTRAGAAMAADRQFVTIVISTVLRTVLSFYIFWFERVPEYCDHSRNVLSADTVLTSTIRCNTVTYTAILYTRVSQLFFCVPTRSHNNIHTDGVASNS